MSVGVGITNPLTSSGPTVTAPGVLPTSTNTVWSTPMRDLGAHIRCSSITTLQDSHIEGQLHQSKQVITTQIVGGASTSSAVTIPAANIYGGIVYLNAGSSTNNYQFDTVANILAAFPSMHNNDFVDLYLWNQGFTSAIINGGVTGEDFLNGQITVGPANVAHVIMNVHNVTAINGATPSITFIASAITQFTASPGFLEMQEITGGSVNGGPVTLTAGTSTTITAADLINQFVQITGAPGAAYSLATDTADNILAALPGAQAGARFTCRVWNNATGETCTITAGTGVALSPASPTIATGDYADFVIVITNSTSTNGSLGVSIYVM